SVGRAIIIDRGMTLFVTKSFIDNSGIPYEGYFIDKATGKVLLEIRNTDDGDAEYGLGPDTDVLYYRVRYRNPNTGEVWYRWHYPVHRWGGWAYEDRGHFEALAAPEPFKNAQGDIEYATRRWVPETRIKVEQWDPYRDQPLVTSEFDFIDGKEVPAADSSVIGTVLAKNLFSQDIQEAYHKEYGRNLTEDMYAYGITPETMLYIVERTPEILSGSLTGGINATGEKGKPSYFVTLPSDPLGRELYKKSPVSDTEYTDVLYIWWINNGAPLGVVGDVMADDVLTQRAIFDGIDNETFGFPLLRYKLLNQNFETYEFQLLDGTRFARVEEQKVFEGFRVLFGDDIYTTTTFFDTNSSLNQPTYAINGAGKVIWRQTDLQFDSENNKVVQVAQVSKRGLWSRESDQVETVYTATDQYGKPAAFGNLQITDLGMSKFVLIVILGIIPLILFGIGKALPVKTVINFVRRLLGKDATDKVRPRKELYTRETVEEAMKRFQENVLRAEEVRVTFEGKEIPVAYFAPNDTNIAGDFIDNLKTIYFFAYAQKTANHLSDKEMQNIEAYILDTFIYLACIQCQGGTQQIKQSDIRYIDHMGEGDPAIVDKVRLYFFYWSGKAREALANDDIESFRKILDQIGMLSGTFKLGTKEEYDKSFAKLEFRLWLNDNAALRQTIIDSGTFYAFLRANGFEYPELALLQNKYRKDVNVFEKETEEEKNTLPSIQSSKWTIYKHIAQRVTGIGMRAVHPYAHYLIHYLRFVPVLLGVSFLFSNGGIISGITAASALLGLPYFVIIAAIGIVLIITSAIESWQLSKNSYFKPSSLRIGLGLALLALNATLAFMPCLDIGAQLFKLTLLIIGVFEPYSLLLTKHSFIGVAVYQFTREVAAHCRNRTIVLVVIAEIFFLMIIPGISLYTYSWFLSVLGAQNIVSLIIGYNFLLLTLGSTYYATWISVNTLASWIKPTNGPQLEDVLLMDKDEDKLSLQEKINRLIARNLLTDKKMNASYVGPYIFPGKDSRNAVKTVKFFMKEHKKEFKTILEGIGIRIFGRQYTRSDKKNIVRLLTIWLDKLYELEQEKNVPFMLKEQLTDRSCGELSIIGENEEYDHKLLQLYDEFMQAEDRGQEYDAIGDEDKKQAVIERLLVAYLLRWSNTSINKTNGSTNTGIYLVNLIKRIAELGLGEHLIVTVTDNQYDAQLDATRHPEALLKKWREEPNKQKYIAFAKLVNKISGGNVKFYFTYQWDTYQSKANTMLGVDMITEELVSLTETHMHILDRQSEFLDIDLRIEDFLRSMAIPNLANIDASRTTTNTMGIGMMLGFLIEWAHTQSKRGLLVKLCTGWGSTVINLWLEAVLAYGNNCDTLPFEDLKGHVAGVAPFGRTPMEQSEDTAHLYQQVHNMISLFRYRLQMIIPDARAFVEEDKDFVGYIDKKLYLPQKVKDTLKESYALNKEVKFVIAADLLDFAWSGFSNKQRKKIEAHVEKMLSGSMDPKKVIEKAQGVLIVVEYALTNSLGRKQRESYYKSAGKSAHSRWGGGLIKMHYSPILQMIHIFGQDALLERIATLNDNTFYYLVAFALLNNMLLILGTIFNFVPFTGLALLLAGMAAVFTEVLLGNAISAHIRARGFGQGLYSFFRYLPQTFQTFAPNVLVNFTGVDFKGLRGMTNVFDASGSGDNYDISNWWTIRKYKALKNALRPTMLQAIFWVGIIADIMAIIAFGFGLDLGNLIMLILPLWFISSISIGIYITGNLPGENSKLGYYAGWVLGMACSVIGLVALKLWLVGSVAWFLLPLAALLFAIPFVQSYLFHMQTEKGFEEYVKSKHGKGLKESKKELKAEKREEERERIKATIEDMTTKTRMAFEADDEIKTKTPLWQNKLTRFSSIWVRVFVTATNFLAWLILAPIPDTVTITTLPSMFVVIPFMSTILPIVVVSITAILIVITVGRAFGIRYRNQLRNRYMDLMSKQPIQTMQPKDMSHMVEFVIAYFNQEYRFADKALQNIEANSDTVPLQESEEASQNSKDGGVIKKEFFFYWLSKRSIDYQFREYPFYQHIILCVSIVYFFANLLYLSRDSIIIGLIIIPLCAILIGVLEISKKILYFIEASIWKFQDFRDYLALSPHISAIFDKSVSQISLSDFDELQAQPLIYKAIIDKLDLTLTNRRRHLIKINALIQAQIEREPVYSETSYNEFYDVENRYALHTTQYENLWSNRMKIDSELSTLSKIAKDGGLIKEIKIALVIRKLSSKRLETRKKAAWKLGEIGDARSVAPLIDTLRDPDSYVRRNVAKALGEIGDKRAVEPLIKAVEDSNSDVRSEAVKALAKLGALTVELEVKRYMIDLETPGNYYFREQAAEALGRIGDKRAIVPLIKAIENS
ncbi:MAG: HEAT repeat domain-containing protein, partial [Candidatus Omnitrophica bacterium]|nr:HEAT repeat domain-containing protein [Candidatus Omnitrophota bacterium]